ncbi:MAG: hypothetical protein EPN48_12870 [Microbacteriaceae bacterium]|nr:MAG: hypothetical protein EPN48_12870 [Microbacteriaceae bacterium]
MSLGSELRREQSALALGRLGRGLNLSACALIVVQFISLALNAHRYPHLGASIAAWMLLATAMAFLMVPWRASALEEWVFPIVLIVGAVIVVLDVIGSWTGAIDGPYPAAATATSALLVACANTQRLRWVLAAAAALCTALAIVYLSASLADPLSLGPRIVVIVLAGLPAVLGISVVRSFRSLVRVESDRAQARAAASVPGNALGLMASQELVRLDLDAERLLQSVATGQAALPLDAAASTAAANIATELRLHLIAGRGKTWLHHAVSESAVLGPLVTVTDPLGLAARLSRPQRDALLSAIWLFVGDLTRGTQSLRVDLHRPEPDVAITNAIAIGFDAFGVPRKQVDAAVWQAIGKVGRYAESSRGTALRIDVDCLIESQPDP